MHCLPRLIFKSPTECNLYLYLYKQCPCVCLCVFLSFNLHIIVCAPPVLSAYVLCMLDSTYAIYHMVTITYILCDQIFMSTNVHAYTYKTH